MQSQGAELRDRLMAALREIHTPNRKSKVVPLKKRTLTGLQKYLDAALLEEEVQIYFASQSMPKFTGMPISHAVEQACKALVIREGRSVDQVMQEEVRTALMALQMFDAALDSCTPPVGEPSIELILGDAVETIGLRIPQEAGTVIVTPSSFMHPTFTFTTSEPVGHPGSWFRPTDEELEAELLN